MMADGTEVVLQSGSRKNARGLPPVVFPKSGARVPGTRNLLGNLGRYLRQSGRIATMIISYI